MSTLNMSKEQVQEMYDEMKKVEFHHNEALKILSKQSEVLEDQEKSDMEDWLELVAETDEALALTERASDDHVFEALHLLRKFGAEDKTGSAAKDDGQGKDSGDAVGIVERFMKLGAKEKKQMLKLLIDLE